MRGGRLSTQNPQKTQKNKSLNKTNPSVLLFFVRTSRAKTSLKFTHFRRKNLFLTASPFFDLRTFDVPLDRLGTFTALTFIACSTCAAEHLRTATPISSKNKQPKHGKVEVQREINSPIKNCYFSCLTALYLMKSTFCLILFLLQYLSIVLNIIENRLNDQPPPDSSCCF